MHWDGSARAHAAASAAVVAAVAVVILVGSPVLGWFQVVRVSAVLLPVLLVPAVASTPWRWSDQDWALLAGWQPTKHVLAFAAGAATLLLAWIVFSRFQAGGINAVDFTVYFDRPLFQSSRAHWYFVESTDDARFDNLTHLAVHGYWILLPLAALYWVYASPYWLLALSVAAVVAGSVYVYWIVRRIGGSGILAVAAALAFLLNDNTARTLNYGFHAEVLYAWFITWAIDAGLRRSRASFLAAVIASALVKEDAIFPLVAVSTALALTGTARWARGETMVFLVLPAVIGVLSLGLFYQIAVPRMSPTGNVMYSFFWASQGATPLQALRGLLSHPRTLVAGLLTSGFFSIVLVRHFFLPMIAWRWILGLLPMLLIYGVSDNDQVREFGIYYAIPLVPFLSIASAVAARRVAGYILDPHRAEVLAATLVVLSALTVGLGYSVRPWKAELAGVQKALETLGLDTVVLVQSGLYPHAGYAPTVKLLALNSLSNPDYHNAIVLLAPGLSAYPLTPSQRRCLEALPSAGTMPGGLMAVRLDGHHASCLVR
ncbi:MAG: DUF2079 domain-containing protein [Vicinamibacterales bacterium]